MRKKFDVKEFAFVPPPYGGVSVYVKRLINQLSKDGYAVGGYYIHDKVNGEFKRLPLYDKWIWIETAKYPFKILKYIHSIANYEIIHSHFSLEGMLYLWTFKTFCRKKIVVTVHNSMCANFLKKTNFINKFFLKVMLQSNVQWVAVSNQAKSAIESLSFKIKNPIHVIPAYIPDLCTDYAELSSDVQLYLNQHEKNIAFYGHSFMTNGSNTDVYGFKTVIRLYSILLQNCQSLGLVICLSDASEIDKIAELHKLAKECGVDDSIFWQIGAINNIKKLWEQVHIYFRPTSTDGDSVAVREALDEGVIVVASDVAFRPDGVIKYRYGDIKDAVDKVLLALKMPKEDKEPNMKYYEDMKRIYDSLLLR